MPDREPPSPEEPCLCGSGDCYDQCCWPFLVGDDLPETAEALMRSRYVAFALADARYLYRTWHPAKRPRLQDLELSSDLLWTGLTVLSTKDGGEDDQTGVVEFEACFSGRDGQSTLHERSRFQKIDNHWVYVSGKQPGTRAMSASIGRNQPCPCGSGKKYKRCCA